MLVFFACAGKDVIVPDATEQESQKTVSSQPLSLVTETPFTTEYTLVDSSAANRASRYRWGEVIEILEQKARATHTTPLQAEKYLLAIAYAEENRAADAIPLFNELAADTSFLLWPDAALKLAEIYADEDSSEKVLAILDSPLPTEFRKEVLTAKFEILAKKDKTEEALSTLDTLLRYFPDSYSGTEIKLLRAKLRLKAGDTLTAVASFRDVLKGNKGASGMQAASALDALDSLENKDLYYAGKAAFATGRYTDSEDYFSRYLKTGESYERGDAEYYGARAKSKRGHYSEAISSYSDMLKRKSYNSAWLHLGIAYCYRKLGQYTNAGIALDSAIANGSGTNAEAEALWEGVELAEDMGDFAIASEFGWKLVQKFPNHTLGDNGAVWAGLGAYIVEDYSAAAERFARIPGKYSDRKFTELGRYWQGVSLLSIGDSSGIEALQEVADSPVRHYYRYMAREILTGESLPNPSEAASGRWISYSEAIGRARSLMQEMGHQQAFLIMDSRNAKRAELFAQMGLTDDAEVAFESWMSELNITPSVQLALLSVATDWGLTGTAYAIALKLVNDLGGYASAPIEIIRLAYPTFHESHVRAAADAEGIDCALLFAIMRRESAFKPHVVSYAGAIGLCQFIPTTGEATAKDLGEDTAFDSICLYDWELSIRYGAHYLAGLLREHKLPEYALAEYNAGPGPTARWKRTPHETNRAAFVETVDFFQTRHYIKNVLGDYYAYRELWDG